MTQLTAYQKLFTDDHVHYVVNVVMLLFYLFCPHFSEFKLSASSSWLSVDAPSEGNVQPTAATSGPDGSQLLFSLVGRLLPEEIFQWLQETGNC